MVFPAGLERTKRTCARGEERHSSISSNGVATENGWLPLPRTTGKRTTSSASGMLRPGNYTAPSVGTRLPPLPSPGIQAGNRLTSGHQNGDVIVWDNTFRSALRTLNRGNAPIPALCFSPAGDMLAAAVGDRVCVWNPATGEFRKSLAGHARAVGRIKWNASGKLLATSGLSLTRSESGIWRATNPSKSSSIRRAGPLVPGRRLFAWHGDGKTFAWESSRARECRSSIWKTRQNGRKSVRTTRWAQLIWNSARTAITFAAFGPKKVSVWNWRKGGEPLARPSGTIGGWLADSAPAASGRARNARAHSRFRRHRRERTAGIFDGHLAEIYSLRPRRLSQAFLQPGPIAPCGRGR